MSAANTPPAGDSSEPIAPREDTRLTATTENTAKTDCPSTAPATVIKNLATEIGVFPGRTASDDTLSDLLSPSLALTLFTIFLKNYARWVRFDPESDPAVLLADVARSPLLLCACSLIAVRHTNEDLATSLAPKLHRCASTLVSAALLTSPQPIEFFKAAVILSMWSTTVDQVPFSMDSWLLSGFALQHCQSTALFEDVTNPTRPARFTESNGDYWCIWNFLCMVHLQYCVGMSRRPILQSWQIERCRAVVDSGRATNHEQRMVAEVFLYATLSRHSSPESVDVLRALAALRDWKRDWGFLLGTYIYKFVSSS